MVTLYLVRLSHVEGRDVPLEDGSNQWAHEETEGLPKWLLITETEKARMDETIIPDDPFSYTRVVALKIEEDRLPEEDLLVALRVATLERTLEFWRDREGARAFHPHEIGSGAREADERDRKEDERSLTLGGGS